MVVQKTFQARKVLEVAFHKSTFKQGEWYYIVDECPMLINRMPCSSEVRAAVMNVYDGSNPFKAY